MDIADQPAFTWWVPHILKKRERIIAMTKQCNDCYLNRTHKFGIAIPKTFQKAYVLDREDGNTLWADTIAKELNDVCIAFKILDPLDPNPVGYQKILATWFLTLKWKTFAVRHGLSLVAM